MRKEVFTSRRLFYFFFSFLLLFTVAVAIYLSANNPTRGIGRQQFSLLSWNVADPHIGFLEGYDDGQQAACIKGIKADIVGLQEDFLKHIFNRLVPYFKYKMAFGGGIQLPFGWVYSGLSVLVSPNYVSNQPEISFYEVIYRPWTACNNNQHLDCWGQKGFSLARLYVPLRTSSGWIFPMPIHYYNLHTDAGRSNADIAARDKNFNQLSAFMDSYSKGMSVIVSGDFNCYYQQTQDRNILQSFMNKQNLLMANNPYLYTTDNGTLDYVLYRTGDPRESLQHYYFNIDSSGDGLSDHKPLLSKFDFTANYDAFPDLVILDILSFEYSISTETGIAYIVVKNNGPAASQVTNIIISITGIKRVNGYGQVPKLNSGQSAIVQAGMDVILNRRTNNKVRINATINSNIGPVVIRENNELNNYLQKLVDTQFVY